MESRHLAVMMTDIQGFTRATSGMGREQVEELLALHEDLLVPVIKEFDGTIVKGLGDAFLVTFESPTRGVEAGVRIQEVLAEHNAEASDEKKLRVRVALNAGEVNIRDGDVFGEAVNITARVEGVCASEQVTLTEAVFLLLDREAVETEYLEEVELKGIPFPVKLYRVSPTWLPPEDRDVARARSQPKPAAPTGKGGPTGRHLAAAGALAALVALGAWAVQPAPAHQRLREVTEAGAWGKGWEVLEQGLREQPTPELQEAAAAFGRARLDELREAGKWQEAFATQTRLVQKIPGVEGLTRPEDRVALAKEGIEALRDEEDWAGATALRDALLEVDRLEGDEDLLRWAQEDLARLWDEICPPGEPPPEDLETRIAAPAVTAAFRRLRERDRDSPLLAVVAVVRAAFANDESRLRDRWQELSTALGRNPELGERQELRPALRIFCEQVPPPAEGERAWSWAGPTVQRKLGDWVDPALVAWANTPPGAGHDPAKLLANQYLRRNALQLAARRGLRVVADAGMHVEADARALLAAGDGLGHDRRMAELQSLVLRYQGLTPEERQGVDPLLRELVSRKLLQEGETPSVREEYSRAAQGFGFDDLVDPHRELARDLAWMLEENLGAYRFQETDWNVEFTRGRLARVDGEIPEPWRSELRALLQGALPAVEERFPRVLPQVKAALEALGS